jgi:ribonuclease P protein component
MCKNTFSKNERLKSRKEIAAIFQQGKVLKTFPLRFHYTLSPIEEGDSAMNVGFVVPKRNFKKAVDRNKYKRRMFEAVRLNRAGFLQKLIEQKLHINIMVVYIHRDGGEFKFIEKAVKKGFEKLETKL